jgi:hypothetical protein
LLKFRNVGDYFFATENVVKKWIWFGGSYGDMERFYGAAYEVWKDVEKNRSPLRLR